MKRAGIKNESDYREKYPSDFGEGSNLIRSMTGIWDYRYVDDNGTEHDHFPKDAIERFPRCPACNCRMYPVRVRDDVGTGIAQDIAWFCELHCRMETVAEGVGSPKTKQDIFGDA